MKAPRDSYIIALLIFNLGAGCVCVCAQRHAQTVVDCV